MDARPHNLPLPTEVGRAEYLAELEKFLSGFAYRDLGWCEDKEKVRDTGPYLNGLGYQGTHPPVHLVYSPGAIDWLMGGRRAGEVPDGTLIIKEQWYSVEVDGEVRSMMPAAAYQDLSRDELDALLVEQPVQAGWTAMIKDSAGSESGWFWTETSLGHDPLDPDGFGYLTTNFGGPCERCHASAQTESTFISTDNIEGFPGESILYEIEEGWRTQTASAPAPADHYKTTPAYQRQPGAFVPWLPGTKTVEPEVNKSWLAHYPDVEEVPETEVRAFPPSSLDYVPHPPMDHYFVTANQCLGCHGALKSYGSAMFEHNSEPGGMGTDISPFGDWRFTPMGLAGRDPIFFAQLETEIAMVKADGASDQEVQAFREGLDETCMSCHGGPGMRQAGHDGVQFKRDFIYIDDPKDPNFKYGALARDGISCTMCHHVVDKGTETEFFDDYDTGRFEMGPPDVLYGPYQNNTVHPKPMHHGSGFRPEFNANVSESSKSSKLCGHCHTIDLPVIDSPLANGAAASEAFPIRFSDPKYPFPTHSEQATYTEWLNSQYQTVFGQPSPQAQSCQGCHMAKTFEGKPINTLIAAIQDSSYPETENMLPGLDLEKRNSYARHQLVGLNVPLLQMFNQFYDILGVSKTNYMSGLDTALNNNMAAMLDQAATRTVNMGVKAHIQAQEVLVDVRLENLVGHRFPSGVAFRRAWLEVRLLDKPSGDTLWASGRPNDVGIILGADGKPLPTEFFTDDTWQPHHEVIDSQDQAQIYEEVAINVHGTPNYSFLRRDKVVKDNRLLPKGWTHDGPSNEIPLRDVISTRPHGRAKDDPDYTNGSGMDETLYRIPLPPGAQSADLEVDVALHYQIATPAYLQEKFKWSPDAPATKRLYYLMSNLKTTGTPVEGWKLTVAQQTASVE